MAASRVLGIVKVVFNGVDFGTKPGATMKLGGFKKTPVFGSGVLAGYSHEPEPCEVHCTLIMKSSTDTEKIRTYEGQIDYVTDIGITYSSADAVVSESVDIGADGLGVVIMGSAAVKI